jgi:hypothetical protein
MIDWAMVDLRLFQDICQFKKEHNLRIKSLANYWKKMQIKILSLEDGQQEFKYRKFIKSCIPQM